MTENERRSRRVRLLGFAGGWMGFIVGLGTLSLLFYFLWLVGLPAWAACSATIVGACTANRMAARRTVRIAFESKQAILRAEEIVDDEPEEALALVRGALADGVRGDWFVQAWCVAGRALALTGDLDAAEEALEQANRPRAARDAIWVRLVLQTAFVKAALGEIDFADECLRGIRRRDARNAGAFPDLAKARALVAYRRGDFSGTIDIATEALAGEEDLGSRDRAMLDALKQSSFLRLGGGGPMRAASAPRSVEGLSEEDQEWAHAIVRHARAERRE